MANFFNRIIACKNLISPRRLAIIAGLLFSILFLVAFFWPRSDVSPDKAWMDLSTHQLSDLTGHKQSLVNLFPDISSRGVFVVFWAPWCESCREELTILKENKTNINVSIVLIALDKEAPVKAFVNRLNITYPVLLADNFILSLFPALGNKSYGLPFSIFVHKDFYKAHEGAIKSKQQLLSFLDSSSPGDKV